MFIDTDSIALIYYLLYFFALFEFDIDMFEFLCLELIHFLVHTKFIYKVYLWQKYLLCMHCWIWKV